MSVAEQKDLLGVFKELSESVDVWKAEDIHGDTRSVLLRTLKRKELWKRIIARLTESIRPLESQQ